MTDAFNVWCLLAGGALSDTAYQTYIDSCNNLLFSVAFSQVPTCWLATAYNKAFVTDQRTAWHFVTASTRLLSNKPPKGELSISSVTPLHTGQRVAH